MRDKEEISPAESRLELARFQLGAMGVEHAELSLIRQKAGIVVAQISAQTGTSIRKVIEEEDGRREIANYRMLGQLGVPTINVRATTERALLLEDVAASEEWRLGDEADLADTDVATSLATWYPSLHEAGRECLAGHDVELYDEARVITRESLRGIARATATEDLLVWLMLGDNFEELVSLIAGLRRTLTHNDFYWTNLVVSSDRTAAMMVDYDLLGQGYAYVDVRNFCSSLELEAAAAFRNSYGATSEAEKLVDRVAAPLVTLHDACARSTFPAWGKGSRRILTTELKQRVDELLETTRKSLEGNSIRAQDAMQVRGLKAR